ncbi:YbfB/YjiJ family MFS transporter [Micromonospora chokoriensis]|uniref:Predicted arabinose efflux permease, MFS family n=1 Tax=Micromonospora chokoriensis TaxID=356851 RepID=A0A1C4X2U7_9ACTN|nr:YbfB/YjiJ family MFS transporter [Micromonospora chokoriensis]SCF02797.1 Predicted arabinose efflux permease, MFS family [Micromonospora chokoriensis]
MAAQRTVQDAATPPDRSWRIVGRTAAALAAGMGIGRFVYTPILPLMQEHAGLSPRLGANLATANYLGYLLGAMAAIVAPALLRSRRTLRVSLVILVGTLALMPAGRAGALWIGLRLVAGVVSALIFVIAVDAVLSGLRGRAQHLAGWAFGGVGAGIALSGALVLVMRTVGSWEESWWWAAALTLACAVMAWRLDPGAADPPTAVRSDHRIGSRSFAALLTSYSLEGIGYIIAGTFLVAAIDQSAPDWVGSGAWILVGLAALPSAALWAGLAGRWSRPTVLLVALLVQTVGVVLPVLTGRTEVALVSALIFGGTFLGIATTALAIGAHLGVPRAVAILTTGYSAGQIIGPLAVTPLLRDGYRQALLLGAVVVALAAVAAGALRHRFPSHDDAPDDRMTATTGRLSTPGVESVLRRPADEGR